MLLYCRMHRSGVLPKEEASKSPNTKTCIYNQLNLNGSKISVLL